MSISKMYAVTHNSDIDIYVFNPLNPELNPICHLLALLGVHPILHVSRIRINVDKICTGRLLKRQLFKKIRKYNHNSKT